MRSSPVVVGLTLMVLPGCDLTSPADPSATEELLFEVPKGATARGLAEPLAQAGLVQASWRWSWYIRVEADGSCIKAGKHRVTRAMDAPTLLATLCAAPVPDDVPFAVIEGWRVRDIDAALAAKGWCQPGVYIAAATHPETFHATFPLPTGTLEGYLYPETYMVSPDRFDAHVFIQRQLDTFAQRFYDVDGKALARPLHDVVTMASMIEREEPSPTNRPLVAGILWKRIDAGWNLGVDATSRYALDDWNDRTAFMARLQDPSDPWNTRLRLGLPSTPIGNPGVVALRAAAAPEDSPYWYYLHDAAQQIHPSRTVQEHEAYRRKYNVY